MRRTELDRRDAGGRPTFCLFVTIPHHITVEIAGLLGFGLVILDDEQIGASTETMRSMILAAEKHGLSALVRLAEASAPRIQHFLSMGAQGVLLPGLRTIEEVRRFAAVAKYPPDGTRGLGHSRASAYGLREDWATLMPRLNEETTVHVIVETAQLLERVEDVAKLEHVDALDVGLLDLSAALGCPGDTRAPQVQAAMDRIIAAAHAAGKPVGAAASTPEAARQLVARGLDTLVLDTAALLRLAAQSFITVVQS